MLLPSSILTIFGALYCAIHVTASPTDVTRADISPANNLYDRAGGQCLPSVALLLKKARSSGHKKRVPIGSSESESHDHSSISKSKRALTGQQIYTQAGAQGMTQVPMAGSSARTLTDNTGKHLTAGGISTKQMCGCTSVFIVSQKVSILVHITEKRADFATHGWWFLPPAHAAQVQADAAFMTMARTHLGTRIQANKALLENHQPHAVIIAPYCDSFSDELHKEGLKDGFYYQSQVNQLTAYLNTQIPGIRVIPKEYCPTPTGEGAKGVVMGNIEKVAGHLGMQLYFDGYVKEDLFYPFTSQ